MEIVLNGDDFLVIVQGELKSRRPLPGNLRDIKRVAVCNRRVIFLCTDGSVLRCCHKTPDKDAWKLIEVPLRDIASPVMTVGCGDKHMLLVTESGVVYMAGDNCCGQLGNGRKDIKRSKDFNPVMFPTGPPPVISKVGCGPYHTVVVSTEGKVLTWGGGAYGRLGHNNTETMWAPKQIRNFGGTQVVSVAVGQFQTGAVTEGGELYMCGGNQDGQLGLGNKEEHLVLTKVGSGNDFGNEKVNMVACGHTHTLALTETGDVWSWGSGSNGCLGLPDNTTRLVPTRVSPLEKKGIVTTVVAGFENSAVVLDTGSVYGWGRVPVQAQSSGKRKRGGGDCAGLDAIPEEV